MNMKNTTLSPLKLRIVETLLLSLALAPISVLAQADRAPDQPRQRVEQGNGEAVREDVQPQAERGAPQPAMQGMPVQRPAVGPGPVRGVPAQGRPNSGAQGGNQVRQNEAQNNSGPRPAQEIRPAPRPDAVEASARSTRTVEAQERLGHVRAAMEHLRAAGMNDQADRLAQQAERMHEEIQAMAEAARPQNPPGLASVRPIPPSGAGDAAAIHAELQELRQAMQQMNRRMEELSRR